MFANTLNPHLFSAGFKLLWDTNAIGLFPTICTWPSVYPRELIRRNLDLGQIVVKGTVNFLLGGELMSSTNSSGVVETITSTSNVKEYQSTAYYIDGNSEIVDVDPHTGPGGLITEQTQEDVYFNVNESLRNILIIRPELIVNVLSSFKEALRT